MNITVTLKSSEAKALVAALDAVTCEPLSALDAARDKIAQALDDKRTGAGDLTDAFCRSVSTPGRYPDGANGLRLQVQVGKRGNVAKSWVQRVTVRRMGRVELGLGAYPVVTLRAARVAATANAGKAFDGVDPRTARPIAAKITLAECLDGVVSGKERAGTWKPDSSQGRTWRNSLSNHAAALGAMPVSAIATADVLAVLGPLAETQPDVAKRLRQRLDAAFKWAIANGHRQDNPAGDTLTAALPRPRQVAKHHGAVPHADVSAAIAKVGGADMGDSAKRLIEFVILTAARSGEARGARWAEVDFADATWTVPGERMKAGRAHVVPLSSRAVAILREARDATNGDLIFPRADGAAFLAPNIGRAVKAAGIEGTLHGFRSSFRDWVADTGRDGDVAEAALAHSKRNQVEAAYNRTDLLERRRAMMQEWSDYITP